MSATPYGRELSLPEAQVSSVHICGRRLAAEGNDVLCVDNFYTGTRDNVADLLENPRFELLRHDVTFPLYVEADEIYNLACPASPVHYQYRPVQTTKTSVHGAINMLGLAKRLRAKILQASTSEVYGDPTEHPQTEEYWGNVNPIGPRALLRRRQEMRRNLVLRLPTPLTRDQGRTHIQHLRTLHASERRARRFQFHHASAAPRVDHRVRRRNANAIVLLRI